MELKDLKEAREFAINFGVKSIVYGPAGTGKCLGKGTPVLMYDGSIRNVELIKEGELLMGPDSLPRKVVSLAHGFEEMLKVIPVKGDNFITNRSHIHSLWLSGKNAIINITYDYLLKHSKDFIRGAKLWRSGVDFSVKKISIHPYLLGLWLGDGSSDELAFHTIDNEIVSFLNETCTYYKLTLREYKNKDRCPRYRLSAGRGSFNDLLDYFRSYNLINNKHIPFDFKTNSKEIRLLLLAGLIDSDGHLGNNVFSVSTKFIALRDDICYLARSLGLAAYWTKTLNKSQNGTEGVYYRISISGDVDKIPNKLKRKQASKRKQIKNALVTGFEMQPIGFGEYFGFELEGPNKLFLLGDFTVTHNTPIANTAPKPVLLATEPGLLSMRKSTIPTWIGNTKARIDEFFKWFEHSGEAKGFDTLVIDSVSQMCEIALDDAKRRIKHGLQQYGDMAEYIMPYMERLYFMPQKHMYLIAKEETQESGFKRPYYPGKMLAVSIPHRYDLIMRVAKTQLPNIGEVTAFQCNGTYDVMARNRVGTLDTFEQPDFTSIIRKCMT